MLTPVKSVSLQFTSDGTSTALVFDLSTAPIGLDFTGQEPIGALTPICTFPGGTLALTSVTLAGTIATATFPAAPPEDDVNSNLITYTLTFLLQFGG
jgi:hypothetical protein